MSSDVAFSEPGVDTQAAQRKMHHVSRVGVSKEEVTDTYKSWASAYDKDVDQVGWNAPRFGAELLKETLGDRKDARVLDGASGTGLGGKIMKEMGYTNIDALDCCKEMLEESKKYEAYTNFIEAFMDKSRLPIEDDSYDMVITYGSFVPGHVNEECFTEMARVIKPGGYFGMVMCERYFKENPEYAGNIEPHMKELQEAGVWTRRRREIIPHYHGEYDGVKFLCQLNEKKNEALKTLA